MLTRRGWTEERLLLAFLKWRRGEKWRDFIENCRVACCFNVFRRDERQPQQVVGKSRAQPVSRIRVPPMQYVALRELHSGVAQELGPREIGTVVDQCRS